MTGVPDSIRGVRPQQLVLATADDPFELVVGGSVGPVTVEYETYGRLAPQGDNVVLVCHALSGDAHAAGWSDESDCAERPWRARKPGWWNDVIGPGRAIDTDRFFVVCMNVLGGCYGTTGPASIDPATGSAYGMRFPIVTIQDWVRLQAAMLDRLGIDRVRLVVGGSLGGQQAIEWSLAYPDRIDNCLIMAASPRLSSQGLAFNAVGRYSIMNDPAFCGGHYYHHDGPRIGLAAARMLAHITYLSDEGMHHKFGRRLQDKEMPDFGFGVEFAVESYLDYQGRSFVDRFDANSYLYITRAMDYYDAAARWGDGDLVTACKRIRARIGVVSFSSDWLYPPEDCREFAMACQRAGKVSTYVDVPSRGGHDAFLVETDTVGRLLRAFLEAET